jgi:hypothetical protein
VKSSLKKLLFGIHHPKEYICAPAGEISGGLNCFAIVNGEKAAVTENFLFLGYRPLIMGWLAEKFDGNQLTVLFERKDNSETVAKLNLKLVKEFQSGENKLFFFTGISSTQEFESGFHQFMFKWHDRFRSKGPGNIDLDPELYNQVKIAYSIPREIKLVTLCNEKGFNVFPTDLHGKVGNEHYLISLRHDKKACAQLEETGKLALWTVDAKHASEVYAMGKNHSQDLAPKEKFSFTENESALFHFPEPVGAIGCEEFEIEKIIGDVGIHRLFLLKSKSVPLIPDPRRLVHLHRSYVQWHVKTGFPFTEAKRIERG